MEQLHKIDSFIRKNDTKAECQFLLSKKYFFEIGNNLTIYDKITKKEITTVKLEYVRCIRFINNCEIIIRNIPGEYMIFNIEKNEIVSRFILDLSRYMLDDFALIGNDTLIDTSRLNLMGTYNALFAINYRTWNVTKLFDRAIYGMISLKAVTKNGDLIYCPIYIPQFNLEDDKYYRLDPVNMKMKKETDYKFNADGITYEVFKIFEDRSRLLFSCMDDKKNKYFYYDISNKNINQIPFPDNIEPAQHINTYQNNNGNYIFMDCSVKIDWRWEKKSYLHPYEFARRSELYKYTEANERFMMVYDTRKKEIVFEQLGFDRIICVLWEENRLNIYTNNNNTVTTYFIDFPD